METNEVVGFVEMDCQQNKPFGETICGDVFLSRRIKEEGRTVVVLLDGMGSGVKANAPATLTTSMLINLTWSLFKFQKQRLPIYVIAYKSSILKGCKHDQ